MEFFINVSLITIFAFAFGETFTEKGKDIGFRSIILLMLGSFIFTYLSTRIGGDPARVIAQIVVGTSFLSAGIIFKSSCCEIRNVTTAIAVWVISSISVLIGLNMRREAIIMAVVVFIVLKSKKINYEEK